MERFLLLLLMSFVSIKSPNKKSNYPCISPIDIVDEHRVYLLWSCSYFAHLNMWKVYFFKNSICVVTSCNNGSSFYFFWRLHLCYIFSIMYLENKMVGLMSNHFSFSIFLEISLGAGKTMHILKIILDFYERFIIFIEKKLYLLRYNAL